MIVREARPASRYMVFVVRMHSMVEGSNHKTPSVSNTLETRKVLGRILRARLLIVRGKLAEHIERYITLIVTKEQFDCADFWLLVSGLTGHESGYRVNQDLALVLSPEKAWYRAFL